MLKLRLVGKAVTDGHGSRPADRQPGHGVASFRVIGATVASVLVLSACGGTTSSPSSPAASRSATAGLRDTFGHGVGTLSNATWDLSYGEPPTLDPAGVGLDGGGETIDNLCEPLIRYNPNYTISPDIAVSWRYVNPVTLVFNLRKGVRFSDGTELTSADVLYSLRHDFNPSEPFSGSFSAVRSVEANGPYQVTFHLSHPDELLIDWMPTYSADIFEKAAAVRAGKAFGTTHGAPVCTGPYELKSWTPGKDEVITANPYYWDSAHRPHVKTWTLDFITNFTTLAEDLVSGAVDGATEIDPSTIPRLASSPTGHLLYGPSQDALQLFPAVPGGLTGSMTRQSIDLREALFTSINRSALARVVFNGAATPTYTFLNPQQWDQSALAQYQAAYRPYARAGATWGTPAAVPAAKALVKASGYHGQSIGLGTLAGNTSLVDTAELIQQQAKAIGVNIKIVEMQPATYNNLQPSARKGQGLFLTIGPSYTRNPLEQLYFELLGGSLFDLGGYNNPEVNRLLATARETYDSARRAALVIQAQSIAEKQWPAATLLNVDEISYLNSSLSGMVTSFAYVFEPYLALIGKAG